MATVKLYYENAFLQDFTAVVESCGAVTGGFAVVLDRTAFYPEGGGQPADHGTLGDTRVLDVHEKDGVVTHLCDRALPEGAEVSGHIDWARRFDHMQQHSGEHILSGILCHDYHCDNVGFHLGADTVTIDYNTDISWEQALDAERKANEVIWADAPVEITYPSPAQLEALDYRSKKALTGQVRIVTFPEADCCACCGTHVLRAGQVGLIKVLSCQKFREGVRMEIVSGQRALAYLDHVYDQARSVGQRLSVKPGDILPAVERLEEEQTALKGREATMEDQLFQRIAAEHAGAENVLVFQPALRPDGVRRLADALAHQCGGLTAVFAGEDGHFNYALLRADGADINPQVKAMNSALHGRGGGRNGFAQGSVQASEGSIRNFFNNLT